MKKALLFMMALLIGSLSAHADFVTQEEAEAKAQNFISQHVKRASSGNQSNSKVVARKKQLICVSKAEKPAYYIFNYADSTGFVIVSAESNTLEILAYSDEGYFHEEDIDKGADVFLAQYECDAAIARANALTDKQRKYVRNAAKAASSTEVLLVTALLNQTDGYWYEKFAPMANAPAGCNATAAAITMHYHQWPAKGKGSASYVSPNISLSRDFSKDTYNWSCIPIAPYVSGLWSEEAKNEVPKILLACGISCYTNYNKDASGASLINMAAAMVNNFSYGVGYKYYSCYGVPEADMTEAWQAVRNSIDNNMPVLVEGTGPRGGHAFVLDGYNSQYYHYNMGWGGSNNGWWSNGSISSDNYRLDGLFTDISPQTGKILLNGTTPDGLSYKLDDRGVLRMSEKGEITKSDGDFINTEIDKSFDGFSFNKVRECVIEDGVTAVRNHSFKNFNLYYISKLTIPATVREIENNALTNEMTEIIVADDNPVFSSPRNCCLYNKETKTLLLYSKNESEIHFPEVVEILGTYSIYGNEKIVEIDIPEGVKSLDHLAFGYAKNLQHVILPSTLISVGDYCFGYSGIKTVTCKAMNPPTAGYKVFNNTDVATSGTLYVPYDAVEKYAADSNWNVFHEIKPIPGSENPSSAIDVTILSPLPVSKQTISDLSGRRISNTRSLCPGIYIINGKKVMK